MGATKKKNKGNPKPGTPGISATLNPPNTSTHSTAPSDDPALGTDGPSIPGPSTAPDPSRLDAFEAIFSSNRIDVPLLKKLCRTGVPPGYRFLTYQILLSQLGALPESFPKEDAKRRSQYAKHLQMATEDGRIRIPEEVSNQIQIDIKRISSRYRHHDGVDGTPVLSSVLEMTAFKRPYIGYAQGMADLVVPFLYLAMTEPPRPEDPSGGLSLREREYLIYGCYSSLISRIQQDILTMQGRLLCRLEAVMLVVGREILDALDSHGLKLYMICFRWFGCLFIREFDIELWFRIFDHMLSEDIGEFSVFFGAALLLWFRREIIGGDFASVMLLMQNLQEQRLGSEAVEDLLGSASHLMREYSSRLGDVI